MNFPIFKVCIVILISFLKYDAIQSGDAPICSSSELAKEFTETVANEISFPHTSVIGKTLKSTVTSFLSPFNDRTDASFLSGVVDKIVEICKSQGKLVKNSLPHVRKQIYEKIDSLFLFASTVPIAVKLYRPLADTSIFSEKALLLVNVFDAFAASCETKEAVKAEFYKFLIASSIPDEFIHEFSPISNDYPECEITVPCELMIEASCKVEATSRAVKAAVYHLKFYSLLRDCLRDLESLQYEFSRTNLNTATTDSSTNTSTTTSSSTFANIAARVVHAATDPPASFLECNRSNYYRDIGNIVISSPKMYYWIRFMWYSFVEKLYINDNSAEAWYVLCFFQ